MKYFKLKITLLFSLLWSYNYAQTWKTVGLGTGMNASVRALLADSSTNTLIAAGQFTIADIMPTQNMISWNGSEYHPIIPGPTSGLPSGMMVDTANNLLYVSGNFNAIGTNTSIYGSAIWDGSTWSQFGSTLSNKCIYNGELYSAGFSTVKKWTGSSFVDVGINFPTGGGISDVVVYQGNLYACGAFTKLLDQTPAKGIAKFDGYDWTPTGYFASGISYGQDLIVCDSMMYYYTNPSRISSYDGTTWTTIATENLNDMKCYNGDLYVGDNFSSFENVTANSIVKWNGQTWLALGGGITGGNKSVHALEVYNGELYVGGHFTKADSITTSNIASWNGTTWSAPTHGLATSSGDGVLGLAEFNCELMICGNITGTVGETVNCIAQYDGSSWSSIGGGANNQVLALTEYNDSIYVGGIFTSIGNVSANRVAVWDGANYSALGTGIASGWVYALAVYNGELYVGGNFQTAGSANIPYIAKWNGSVWDTVGDGLNERVYALTVYNGELYAGGAFSASDNQMLNGIAKWNGSTWMPVSSGTDGDVQALCVHNNELYIGGDFSIPGNNIAKWDGTLWTTLGSGTNGDVMSLTSINGLLYAGGQFFSAGGNSQCKRIARWNGNTWQPLATGMNSNVRAVAAYNNKIFAGGDFTYAASNQLRSYIAVWDTTQEQIPVANFSNCNGNICNNDCKIFTNNSLNNPTTYAWSFPGGSPSSSPMESPHVCYDTPGTYSITLISSNSAGSDTSTQSVTIFPVPTTPIVTLSGNELVSSSPIDNQWYFNNAPILGEVSQTYTPSQNGLYYVAVNNTDGCSSISQTFNYPPIITLIQDTTRHFNFSIAPVPSKDKITVTLGASIEAGTIVTIYDLVGKVMITHELSSINSTSIVIPIDTLSPGVYFISVKKAQKESLKKFIKINYSD
jgi:PKD repeat protein